MGFGTFEPQVTRNGVLAKLRKRGDDQMVVKVRNIWEGIDQHCFFLNVEKKIMLKKTPPESIKNSHENGLEDWKTFSIFSF